MVCRLIAGVRTDRSGRSADRGGVAIALIPRLPGTPYIRTSENSVTANYRESPKGEVRRIPIPRTPGNMNGLQSSYYMLYACAFLYVRVPIVRIEPPMRPTTNTKKRPQIYFERFWS